MNTMDMEKMIDVATPVYNAVRDNQAVDPAADISIKFAAVTALLWHFKFMEPEEIRTKIANVLENCGLGDELDIFLTKVALKQFPAIIENGNTDWLSKHVIRFSRFLSI